MKKTLIVLLCSLFVAQGIAKSLVLTLKDGSLVYYLLGGEKNPVMSFTDNEIVVNTDNYQLSGIKNFYISAQDDPNPDAIADVEAPRPTFAQGTFRMKAASADDVTVCTLNGRRVEAEVTFANGEASLNLSQQPRGIYIVRIGKESFKITKK